MTEEIDSIGPVGASAPMGVSGAQDVLPPVSPSPRVAQPQPRPAAPLLERTPATPEPAPASTARAPAAQNAQIAQTAQPAQDESIEDSVKRINARLASVNRVLQLRVDASTGITVAEIRNSATGQVLQQIPSADVVHLAAMLSGWAHGKNVLLDLIA